MEKRASNQAEEKVALRSLLLMHKAPHQAWDGEERS